MMLTGLGKGANKRREVRWVGMPCAMGCLLVGLCGFFGRVWELNIRYNYSKN